MQDKNSRTYTKSPANKVGKNGKQYVRFYFPTRCDSTESAFDGRLRKSGSVITVVVYHVILMNPSKLLFT